MFSLFQGKFIRINFDASGYIAGANIGKKDFTFIFTSRETPMSHVLLNLCPWVGLCVQTTDSLRGVYHTLFNSGVETESKISTPLLEVTPLCWNPDWVLKHGNDWTRLLHKALLRWTKWLSFLLQKPIYWKRHGWFVKQRKNAHFTYSTSFWQAAILN